MTPTSYAEPTTVLITGATDGIGRALAQQYAARNVRLVLVGKRPHAEVAASDADLYPPHRYCQADLRDPACATQTITRFLAEQAITRLDVLLHNAGIGWYGPLAAQPTHSIDELLAVNLAAPIQITHALLPLVQRVRGTLVLVSSIAADLPSPDYPIYCASKAALDGFARSLRIELGDTAQVLVVHPGPTRTAIHTKSGIPTNPARLQRYPAAAWVARRTIAAIEQQRSEATPGALFQLVRQLGRHTRLPDLAYHLVHRHPTRSRPTRAPAPP
ncbi:MAG: SDR family NAD(P)-dependent oxidoreductase, partial [Chloroflexaceae bacterium]|nr:SDR family NAD(P)-dependent oxidoreductase [Chloroflexaceae bacterium]